MSSAGNHISSLNSSPLWLALIKNCHFAQRLYICQHQLSQMLLSEPLKDQENVKTEQIV